MKSLKKNGLKNTLFNVMMGIYCVPSILGTAVIQIPIHKTACLIAKHGKVKKYSRGEKLLMGMMFSGDILGFLISATPLLITSLPFVLQSNDLYHKLNNILEENKKGTD